jgi:hypothetical protein
MLLCFLLQVATFLHSKLLLIWDTSNYNFHATGKHFRETFIIFIVTSKIVMAHVQLPLGLLPAPLTVLPIFHHYSTG